MISIPRWWWSKDGRAAIDLSEVTAILISDNVVAVEFSSKAFQLRGDDVASFVEALKNWNEAEQVELDLMRHMKLRAGIEVKSALDELRQQVRGGFPGLEGSKPLS